MVAIDYARACGWLMNSLLLFAGGSSTQYGRGTLSPSRGQFLLGKTVPTGQNILGKYVPWTVFPRRNCPGGHYFGGTEFPMTPGFLASAKKSRVVVLLFKRFRWR